MLNSKQSNNPLTKRNQSEQHIDTLRSVIDQKYQTQMEKKHFEKSKKNIIEAESQFALPRTPPNESKIYNENYLYEKNSNLYAQLENSRIEEDQKEILDKIFADQNNLDLDYMKEYYKFQKNVFDKQMIKLKSQVQTTENNPIRTQKDMLLYNERQIKNNISNMLKSSQQQPIINNNDISSNYSQHLQANKGLNSQAVQNFPDLNSISRVYTPQNPNNNQSFQQQQILLQNKSQYLQNQSFNDNTFISNNNNYATNQLQSQQQTNILGDNGIVKETLSQQEDDNEQNNIDISRDIQSRELQGTSKKRYILMKKLEKSQGKRIKRRNSDVKLQYQDYNFIKEQNQKNLNGDMEDQDPNTYIKAQQSQFIEEKEDNQKNSQNNILDVLKDLNDQEDQQNNKNSNKQNRRTQSSQSYKRQIIENPENKKQFIQYLKQQKEQQVQNIYYDDSIKQIMGDIGSILKDQIRHQPEKEVRQNFYMFDKQQKKVKQKTQQEIQEYNNQQKYKIKEEELKQQELELQQKQEIQQQKEEEEKRLKNLRKNSIEEEQDYNDKLAKQIEEKLVQQKTKKIKKNEDLYDKSIDKISQMLTNFNSK